MDIKIEYDVPIPRSKSGPPRNPYTQKLSEARSGASLIVPAESMHGLRTSLRREFKIVCRKLDDGNYRVWKL